MAMSVYGERKYQQENRTVPAVTVTIRHPTDESKHTTLPVVCDIGAKCSLVDQKWLRSVETKEKKFKRIPLVAQTSLTMADKSSVAVTHQTELILEFPNGKTWTIYAIISPTCAEPLILGTDTMDHIPEGVKIVRHADPSQRTVSIPYGGIHEVAWDERKFNDHIATVLPDNQVRPPQSAAVEAARRVLIKTYRAEPNVEEAVAHFLDTNPRTRELESGAALGKDTN